MPALAVRASLGTAAEGAVSWGSPCSRFLVFMLLCFNFMSEFAIQDLRLCSFRMGIAVLLRQPVARCLPSLPRDDAPSAVPAQRLSQSPWAGGALGEGGPGRASLGADGGCLEEAARGSISVGFSKPFPTIPVGCNLINHGGAVSIPVCSCALWGWRASHLPVGWTSGTARAGQFPAGFKRSVVVSHGARRCWPGWPLPRGCAERAAPAWQPLRAGMWNRSRAEGSSGGCAGVPQVCERSRSGRRTQSCSRVTGGNELGAKRSCCVSG